ncbi:hypothetical protein LX32DRAFT_243423 [Colletotrichum zoysiae]|uniref:Chromatin modification-related protein n=1 Tax=Colletotrichum zoysiae TaxID=1216348 RepID=A0AAD9LX68_9PEZI|nr:hypothetical protein LX32DRAFT_243423 [Colletotrichum zoysiae]
MKSVKAASGDTPSSRRSQPVRQTRTNPPRVSSGLRASANGRDSLAGATASDQPIDIYPAITYFSDAIAALPKELVRHFTLLKEVDAKIFAPEDALFKLVDAAMNAPPPLPRPANDASSSVAPASAPMSAQNSSSGGPLGSQAPPPASSTDGSYTTSIYDPSNFPRRQLFRQTAYKIQEMLGSLEEKNHVISTANDALQKQLSRIDDVWPHVENEFSDEAKWGSTSHWAYPENRAATKAAHTERSRREGAAAISAAAQQLAEEAAARSESRKQAVQAKKSQKTAPQESDFDDAEARNKPEPGKKGHGGGKARKAAETAATVGLGITTNGAPNGTAPQPKRRKVEKTPSGNNVTERAMSTVFGASASKAKTTSPRETPAPEGGGQGGPKKRKALPTGTGVAKKSKNGVAGMSPSVASSPVMSTFPDAVLPRGSPAPTVTPVPPAPKPPTASRAKQSTTQAAAEGGKQQSRPPSSASAKPNGFVPPPTPEAAAPPAPLPKPAVEARPVAKEPSVPPAPEPTKKEPEPTETAIKASSIPAAKQKKETPKPEEPETPAETPVLQTVNAATVTKSGRASKPSTPAMATFQEAARPKSARNTEANNTSKRKKTNNIMTNSKAIKTADQTEDSEEIEDAETQAGKRSYDYTEDEPTYCYCTSVSYGEMVACDANNCEREWFHLNCVGLKVAPKGSSKWYCEECLQRFSKQGKKLSHKYNVLPDSLNMRKQRGSQY